MPRYRTPSQSPEPATRSRPRRRSPSRFSSTSSSSLSSVLPGPGPRFRRPSSRHSATDKRGVPEDRGPLPHRSASVRSSSTSSSIRRPARSTRHRSRDRDHSRHRHDRRHSPEEKEASRNRKIPIGFLAGVGVSALLLQRYWPKSWLHGEEGYWDKLGRDKKDGLRTRIRDTKDRASTAIKVKGERAVDTVMGLPEYEGARGGYAQERERERQRGRGDVPERGGREAPEHAWERERERGGFDSDRRSRRADGRDSGYPYRDDRDLSRGPDRSRNRAGEAGWEHARPRASTGGDRGRGTRYEDPGGWYDDDYAHPSYPQEKRPKRYSEDIRRDRGYY